jgi:hypothetical protein
MDFGPEVVVVGLFLYKDFWKMIVLLQIGTY